MTRQLDATLISAERRNLLPVFESLGTSQTGAFERELALGQSDGDRVREVESSEALLADLRVSADLG